MDNMVEDNEKKNSTSGMGGPQFTSDLTTQPFSTDFTRTLFDTPQSLLSSPQFDMFSPFRSQYSRGVKARCTYCQKEITTNGPKFRCSHNICHKCLESCPGRKCPTCMSPQTEPLLFPPKMFLSPTMTPEHNISDHTDNALCSPTPDQSLSYQNVNGISAALQNSLNLGINEIQEPFNLWDTSSKSNLNTSPVFDTLSAGDDHPPVFSPVGSDCFIPPPSRSLYCSPCGNEARANAYCMNCNEMLCSVCVVAHQRVRVTKDHTVITLEQLFNRNGSPRKGDRSGSLSAAGTSDDSSSRPSSVCGTHEARVLCSCDSCGGAALCYQCLPYHYKHRLSPPSDIRSALNVLLTEARSREKEFEDVLNGIYRMNERIDSSAQSVAREIRSVVHEHINTLEERKRDLLQKLETIRLDKLDGLKAQTERVAHENQTLQSILKAVEELPNDASDSMSQLHICFEQLLSIFASPFLPAPQEVDTLKFIIDENILPKIVAFGVLLSGASPKTSALKGETVRSVVKDRQSTLYLQLRDACGDSVRSGSIRVNQVSASLLAPDGTVGEVNISESGGGVFSLTFIPVKDGRHLLNVAVRGVQINGCPMEIDVRNGRNYGEIAQQGELFSFGKEGSGDGELCRPWGICIDLRGRVLVADRSNNRIQIFDKDGNFLEKFGSGGTRPGKFDRPAGITVNTLNQIIVADKDNHRIQVFDENGTFILKFGERGRPTGMFNYPWGVATNSVNHIAVSDTRNHRVQIFTATGQFVRKCGFETAYFYKHLDSPRGLCYLPDGQLLITDFNNHRLAVLSARNSPEMKVYGSEGDVKGMFCRPQGVKADSEGHILVCDSRNNRIQVFSGEDMRCVAVFGGTPGGTPTGSQSSPQNQSPNQSQQQGFQMPQDYPTPLQAAAPQSMMPFIGTTSAAQFLNNSAVENAGVQPPRPLLDRPTDLAISPDGRVYVVDFGNNCIRVF
ncbi:unnamed protein product [Auanema sp. JU1783]|nr:unnamed protein product [Auanema sp. JU1783]